MGLINIKFRDTTYTLTSNDEEKVLKLAERFSCRVEDIAANLSNATDSKLTLIAALMLEDELERVQANLAKKPKGYSEAEAAEVMCETLDQLTFYIDNLADRIERRYNTRKE